MWDSRDSLIVTEMTEIPRQEAEAVDTTGSRWRWWNRARQWRARRRDRWKLDALNRYDSAAATKGGEVAGRSNTQNLGTFGG